MVILTALADGRPVIVDSDGNPSTFESNESTRIVGLSNNRALNVLCKFGGTVHKSSDRYNVTVFENIRTIASEFPFLISNKKRTVSVEFDLDQATLCVEK